MGERAQPSSRLPANARHHGIPTYPPAGAGGCAQSPTVLTEGGGRPGSGPRCTVPRLAPSGNNTRPGGSRRRPPEIRDPVPEARQDTLTSGPRCRVAHRPLPLPWCVEAAAPCLPPPWCCRVPLRRPVAFPRLPRLCAACQPPLAPATTGRRLRRRTRLAGADCCSGVLDAWATAGQTSEGPLEWDEPRRGEDGPWEITRTRHGNPREETGGFVYNGQELRPWLSCAAGHARREEEQ